MCIKIIDRQRVGEEMRYLVENQLDPRLLAIVHRSGLEIHSGNAAQSASHCNFGGTGRPGFYEAIAQVAEWQARPFMLYNWRLLKAGEPPKPVRMISGPRSKRRRGINFSMQLPAFYTMPEAGNA